MLFSDLLYEGSFHDGELRYLPDDVVEVTTTKTCIEKGIVGVCTSCVDVR